MGKLIINNSICKFEGVSFEDLNPVMEQLLYYNEEAVHEKISMFGALKKFRKVLSFQKDPKARQKIEWTIKKILYKIDKLAESEWVCLLKSDKTFPTGLLSRVQKVINETGLKIEIIDKRVKPQLNQRFEWYNKPFDLRYYQREMVDIAGKNERGVFVSSVGSGKSLIAEYIVMQKSVVTLMIVPSVGLLEQLGTDFLNGFGPLKVDILDAEKVRSKTNLKPIRLITIDSLRSLIKTNDISKLVHDVEMIMVDEIHHAASSSYVDLMPHIDHVYYRYGFSGTFTRNDSKLLDLWGVLSNVLYSYSPKQAIEDGYLTPPTFFVHSLEKAKTKRTKGKKKKGADSQYKKEYESNYCGGAQILMKVADIVTEADEDDVILILVNQKDKAGKIFFRLLRDLDLDPVYVDGDSDKKYVKKVLEDFNKKKIRILIGSKVLGEGINIKPASVLINCQGNKSEIATVQAIGRGVRLFKGKDSLIVHDFRFKGTKYLEKHLEERLDIYERNFGGEIIELS